MKKKYWWVEKIGDDRHEQKSLVIEADSIEQCHAKFERQTGVNVKHCWIENAPTEKMPICWKCCNAVTHCVGEWQHAASHQLIGCKKQNEIHNYEDAKRLCPLLTSTNNG